MVLKIRSRKKKKGKGTFLYKGEGGIVLPNEAREADVCHEKIDYFLKKIKEEVVKEGLMLKSGYKKDPVGAWYYIGRELNDFLSEGNIKSEDMNDFWDSLYDSVLKDKDNVVKKRRKNDFKLASELAKYPKDFFKKVGFWSLWRDILSNRTIQRDKRVMDLIVKELSKTSKTRDESRIFVNAFLGKLKNKYTKALSEEELKKFIK